MNQILADAAGTVRELFEGVPVPVQVLDWVVLCIIAVSWISLPTLLLSSRRYARAIRREREDDLDAGVETHEAEFLWVFVVPALNEEVTIADAVARLQATAASHAVFLVIDDGSDDRTPEILAGLDDPRLTVLTRVAPRARHGKAAALNDAWRHLREDLLTSPAYRGWDEDRVIVTIVDADGRLDPEAPHVVADSFVHPKVGGVQSLVRIYNRRGWLTWGQDVEFSTFGRVYQAGRSGWGSANMGGNGQFNRLSALTELALPVPVERVTASAASAAVPASAALPASPTSPEATERQVAALEHAESRADQADVGPWRDRLTEDQDLGVRLVQAGYASVQENRTWVDQQGVNSLRRLYRQRTRWAQGNWQAFSLVGGTWSRPARHLSLIARLDATLYLITPILLLLTGVCFATSVVLVVVDLLQGHAITIGAWWLVVVFLGLSFGPGFWALCVRGGRWWAPLEALVLVVPYSVYAWLIFPVLISALLRHALGRNSWAKTSRESLSPIEAVTEDEEPVVV